MPQSHTRQVEGRDKIDLDQVANGGPIERANGPPVANAGVVDQDIEAAVPACQTLDSRLQRHFICEISDARIG